MEWAGEEWCDVVGESVDIRRLLSRTFECVDRGGINFDNTFAEIGTLL